MKKMVLGAAALALMFTACKKKEEESKPSNTWKVGSTTYTALQVNSTTGIITAATTENGGNSIAVSFNGTSLPTTGGTYNIKESTSSDNEVMVVATESSSQGTYVVPSGTLTVTVNDGKVTVDMSGTNANYQGMTTKPDAEVSLHLTQP